MRILYLSIVFILTQTSCITIKTVNVGQKTALEHQLMGRFEPLTDEQASLASVRAGDGKLEEDANPKYLKALKARQRQIFNADDVETYKDKLCLGEANFALLVIRECAELKKKETQSLIEKLIAQENNDRETLIDWLMSSDPSLSKASKKEIKKIYHDFMISRSRNKMWYQDNDGRWLQK